LPAATAKVWIIPGSTIDRSTGYYFGAYITMTTTLLEPKADPRGYQHLDFSKGGVQCDLSDMPPRGKVQIGRLEFSPDSPPRPLRNHPQGAVVPEWLDVRPIHRFPQPPNEPFSMPPGEIVYEKFAKKAIKDARMSCYVDNPRPIICGNGDYLLSVVAGDDHYALKPTGWKVNDIFLYRSRDRGQTWEAPVCVPSTHSQHGWPLLRATRRGDGNRLVTMFTNPVPGQFDGGENAGLAWCYSDDHGYTWSEPRRVSPASDPNFMGMFCIQPTETLTGAWIFAPHEGHFVKGAYWPEEPVITSSLYVMRSEDEGQTWEQYPAPWPGGWKLKPNDRLDEGRAICLADGTLRMFSRTQEGHVWMQRGSEDGRAWTEPEPTTLNHPDAPPMVSTLSDGQTFIALIHNSHGDLRFCSGSRQELWVCLSRDAGDTWTEPRFLMVTSTCTTQGMWGNKMALNSYADILADRGMLHIFVPHNWRQVLQIRLPESDIDRLPTASEIGM
jgi:BNR repeat-like domain